MNLNVHEVLLDVPPLRGGTSSIILYSDLIDDWLAQRYGEPDLCLKVFPRLASAQDEWEFVPIEEATAVQNLFAAHGWAPRVYELAPVAGVGMVQVVEFCRMLMETPPHPAMLAPFWALIDAYRIGTRSRVCPGGRLKWDFVRPGAGANWSRNRLLDWGGKYRRDKFPEWDEPQPDQAWEEHEGQ
jgi:hypothetical protein